MAKGDICRVPGCNKTVNIKNTSLCGMHRTRMQKHKSLILPSIKNKFPENIVKVCKIHGELKIDEVKPTYKSRTDKNARFYPYLHSQCKLCAFSVRKKWLLKRSFGMTVIEYNKLFEEQDHKCAICLKEETAVKRKTKTKRRLAIDHCHKTGKIRGLLCSKCNTAIGSFKESIETMELAIKYIRRHNK